MAEQKGDKKKKSTYGKGVSIYYKASQNRWMCDITLEDGSRKQIAGPVGAEYKQVDEKFQKAIAAAKRGELVACSTQTLAEYMSSWIEDKGMELKPGTYQTWKGCIVLHINNDLGAWQLQKLKRVHIQEWIRKKNGQGLAGSTVRKFHGVLRLALQDAVENAILSDNPCKGVKLPRLADEEMQFYDQGEVDLLLSWLATNKHPYEALIGLALSTGMRLGEISALTWDDLDLETTKPTVHVQRTVDYISGEGYVVQEPKTKNSRRKIRISQDMVQILRLHRTRQLRQKAKATIWQEKNLVFGGRTGGYLSPSTVWGAFKRIIDYAGLPEIRFHDLRHTAATLMLLSRMMLPTLQRVLGHSDIRTTMRYVHFLPAMDEEDMQRFNESLFASKHLA